MMIKQIHHDEQMEALRREFLALWKNELRRRAIRFGFDTTKKLAAMEDVAWQAFKAAKGMA